MRTTFHCHECGANVAAERTRALEFMTSSDCSPVVADLHIGTCDACGLLQKDTGHTWKQVCDTIYSNYQIYYQGAGAEQKARAVDGGQLAPRSDLIARFVSTAVDLPVKGDALDIGSGNGAFVQGMVNCFGEWRIIGSDLNEKFRERILSLSPQVSFRTFAELESQGASAELVSLIHCLEHIPAPSHYLATARQYLKPAGVLLIEVPDAELNPFDLVVADHATHFTKKTLSATLEAAGYEVVSCGNLVIGKEITALARPAPAVPRECAPDAAKDARELTRKKLRWLECVMDQTRALAGATKPFGVFGTSIAGAWICGILSNQIDFFVDEDEARIGREYFGIPIIRPSEVRAGSTVFVCLEPNLAEQIVRRHDDRAKRYISTPRVP